MLRVLDLFSGIGGFSLGLERTGGFKTVAFCEIEAFPRQVLAKHWPGVPIYHDVRELTIDTLQRDGIAVDVICGGFPCQDISLAGKGAGIEGARSGLWSEYARLIGKLRPRFVIVENVAALLARGMDRVLRDLSAFGYDAEWDCIPASAVGAPHRRDRVWIIAHANSQGQHVGALNAEVASASQSVTEAQSMADSVGEGWADYCGSSAQRKVRRGAPVGNGDWGNGASNHWQVEPDVGRVANGIPHGMDRLRALGNSIVPQIVELIGRAILSVE